MLKPDLDREFRIREPWVTKFVIDGEAYGGQFDALSDPRVGFFFQSFPGAKSVLELGSLEGGHTFALARRTSRVVAIEGRDSNVKRAKFVQSLLGVDNIEFVEANLETTELSQFGTFDAVYCVGLLYHLPRPWELIQQIARVSSNVYLWTHYASEKEADERAGSYQGKWYAEHGATDPLSGLSPKSFWPTLAGLRNMLVNCGFNDIRTIEDDTKHIHGPCVTLSASAS